MDKAQATLIAATIAAIASVAKLIFDRYSESRASHRELLQPLLAELGEAIAGVVATSTVLAKGRSDKSYSNWYGKAAKEREKLKEVRPKVRYPLWGIDEGLRVLIRLPDWVSHARADKKRLSKLLSRADGLRKMVDVVAFRCYRNGRTPDLLEILQVRFHAWRCRRVFDAGANGCNADAQPKRARGLSTR